VVSAALAWTAGSGRQWTSAGDGDAHTVNAPSRRRNNARVNRSRCDLAPLQTRESSPATRHCRTTLCIDTQANDASPPIMAALWNRTGHYIFALWFLLLSSSSFFFSSPNLSRRRLDVCHNCTHGVALVRI